MSSIVFSAVGRVTGGTGNVILENVITAQNVTDSELAITATTPTRVNASISRSSANFTDGDEFSIRVKADSGKTLYLYSGCLFVTLDCAEKCQVYVPLGTIELTCIGTGFFDLGSRVKLNTSGAGATWFYEATAKRSGSNPQDTRLKDAGVNDSGISGTSDVTGSALSPFPTTGFARLRSGAESGENHRGGIGHQFGRRCRESSGAGVDGEADAAREARPLRADSDERSDPRARNAFAAGNLGKAARRVSEEPGAKNVAPSA